MTITTQIRQRRVVRIARIIWVFPLLLCTARASAQEPAPLGSTSEEIEPRIIGATGTTTLGISGFADRFMSRESIFATQYVVHVDVSRFVTGRIAVAGGFAGTGRVGGDDEAPTTGAGAPAVHMFAGASYYFTPQSMASLYAGPTYWLQLTGRGARDAGTAIGTIGLQGALSSRATFFAEGGYGVALRRGSEGELVSRMLGRIGFRLRI